MIRPHGGLLDLVVLVADADAEQFIRPSSLVASSVVASARSFGIFGETRCETSVRRNPCKSLVGIDQAKAHVLVTFDRHGCGAAPADRERVECEVKQQLEANGHPRERVACVVFEPELEEVLTVAWSMIERRLAERRKMSSPSRSEVLRRGGLLTAGASGEVSTEAVWERHLRTHPKECLQGLLRCLQLKHQPALFADLGQHVSLPALKHSSTGKRIADVLEGWFGK